MRTKSLLLGLALALIGEKAANAQDDTSTKSLPVEPASIQLLYQLQPKKRITSAVSTINSLELQKTVSTTFAGWLTGRLAGLHTIQNSGEPGFDDVALFLRGQSPMILIDGTPQSFPSINPEQIESITLLKDAVATNLLGMRGGNGAILITTKKGSKQGQRIELTAQYGIQRPTQLPKFVSAADYATLFNEALQHEGQLPVYSQSDIDAYRNGTDSFAFPNVDWQKELLKEQAPYQRYDLSISGGNKSTRYFVNLDYLSQNGLLKEKDFNVYKTNSDYKRYILRSNIEVDLNKAITTSLNLFGRIQQTNQPGVTTATLFNNIRNTPNNAYPVLNSDGSLGGNTDYQNNLYGQSVMSGYMPVYERDFKVDMTLKGDLGFITKGLWVKALAALNGYQRETINRSKTFAVFRQSTDGAGNKTYVKYGNTGDQVNSITANSQNRLFYIEGSMGYSATIKQKNHLDALVLVSNDHRMVNTDLPFNYTGVSAKLSYDHNEKYFVDLVGSYNGTERFPSDNRFGFFPAVGLTWDISNESFLKNRVSWLDALKLRTSIGKTGNANVGYYDYYQYYVGGTGYGFGSTVPSSTFTLTQGALANPSITWEKANKFSGGLEASLFSNRLSVVADYFRDNYYDLVQSRLDGSEILGTEYVRENIGKNNYSGWEFQLSLQEKKGSFSYFISPNLSIIKSEVVYMAEPVRMFEYMRQTGRPVGQAYGYVAEGLFQSVADITSHAFQGAGIVPGDIKYKDLNNDNVIDSRDQTPIGNDKPFVFYGLNTGINFKGIELTVLLQGVRNVNYQLSGYRAFQNNGRAQVYDYQLDRWTASNPDADYPRMFLGANNNNTLTSSYWITTGNFLRVKNIELGYELPQAFTRKARINSTRIFINATNLFTFSDLSDKNIDPEGTAGGYPIMKTIVAGINIKL